MTASISISMLVCGAYHVAVFRKGVFIDGAVVTKIGRFGVDVLVADLDQRRLSAAATRTALAVWLMGLRRHFLPAPSLEPTASPVARGFAPLARAQRAHRELSRPLLRFQLDRRETQLAEFVWGRFFTEEAPAELADQPPLESEELRMAKHILRDAGYVYAKKQDVRVVEASVVIPDEDYVGAMPDLMEVTRAHLASRLAQRLLGSALMQRRTDRRPDIMATVTSARIGIFDPSAFPVFEEN